MPREETRVCVDCPDRTEVCVRLASLGMLSGVVVVSDGLLCDASLADDGVNRTPESSDDLEDGTSELADVLAADDGLKSNDVATGQLFDATRSKLNSAILTLTSLQHPIKCLDS